MIEKDKTTPKAFTLIELLVVIAIIGILSSVVLASLSGARESAKIAAGKQFEHNIRSSLSDCSEAAYTFEGSGNTVSESSGWSGRDGTVYGDPVRVDSLDGLGQAMKFDGSGDYIDFGDILVDNYPEITVSAWIKPLAIPAISSPTGHHHGEGYILHKAGNDDDNLGLTVSTGGTAFYTDMGGYLVTDPLNVGEWVHIAASYDGTNQDIYMNGSRVREGAVGSPGDLIDNSNSFQIGARSESADYFNGLIDNVRIYSCAFRG